MEILKINNLTFTYPCREKSALTDISLIVQKGEFVTLCGKSGCGKSTLLRHLKPILTPHGTKEGSVCYEGRDINELTQREQCEKIGYIMQNPDSQIVTDKVWHELAFGLESLGMSNDEIRIRVAEIASFFGIENLFEENTSSLSGGQKQLINLASVMVMNPSIIILDEPTSQLDPIAAQRFIETLARINRETGTTIILSEHRLEDAVSVCSRLVVMDEGKIIADGSPRDCAGTLKNIKSDMMIAMPTPIKVYYDASLLGECPITVREGRDTLWKNKDRIKHTIAPEPSGDTNKESVLTLKNFWFRYEKDSKDIVKDLSLDIKAGETFAIVGGNGTGKTTTLNLICNILEPQRGKISAAGKISMLPQNPRNLFTRKTVKEELWEMADGKTLTKAQKEELINQTVSLCELNDFMDFHPYDLSGGEMQRAGLAKVLMTKPDILLLDEPTKGLDGHFKEKLASIICSLNTSGVTVVMVSHDIEFCAKHADRCGMFFDGCIICRGTPREFFNGKSFYTTAANRMASGVIDNALTSEDIIFAFTGNIPKFEVPDKENKRPQNKANTSKDKDEPKLTKKNIISGIIFALTFIVLQILFYDKYTDYRNHIVTAMGFLLLALSLINLIPQKELGQREVQTPKSKRHLVKRTIIGAFTALIAIPITIFAGKTYFGDRKYYFISILIIAETLLPFMLAFEKRKPMAREIVILSVLCALGVAGRAAFSAFPQFKPLLAIVIITGVCFGGESGFLVGALSGFISNFFLGQGPWTPWQMFALGIVGFLAGILYRKGILRKTKGSLCLFGFISSVIIYGCIVDIAHILISASPSRELILTAFLQGLPFNLIHGFATGIFLYFAAEPMIEKLDRVKIKYGLI